MSKRIFASHVLGSAVAVFLILSITSPLYSQSAANSAETPAAARMRALNNSLLHLHGQMQQAYATSARMIRGQAATIIAQRSAALASLIQNETRTALSFALSPEALAELTAKFPQSAAQLESHATITGPVQHWIADGPGLKTSRSIWQMNANGRSLNLFFAEREPETLESNQLLQVTGVVTGSVMAVETSASVPSTASTSSIQSTPGGRKTPQTPALSLLIFAFVIGLPRTRWRFHATKDQILTCSKRLLTYAVLFSLILSTSIPSYGQNSCTTKGVQYTAVLLVNFSDISTTVTPAIAYPAFFDTSTGRSLTGYWQEASYGQTSAAGNVFGPFTIGASTSYSCSTVFNQLMNDVLAAATSGGVSLQSYSRIFVVLPNLSCGWAGLTLMGSAGAGCSALNPPSGTTNASLSFLVDVYLSSPQYPFNNARDSAVALAAHEGGHQLGLAHSGTITQRPTAILEPPDTLGQITDGGDLWTVMGSNNLGLYQAQQKAEILGWLTAENYQTISSSGNYALQPLETNPPTALQALKIQRGATPGYYLWVEYKQPIGEYDSTLANAPYTAAQPYTGAMVTYEDPIYTTGGQIPGHTYLVDFSAADSYWLSPDLNPGQSWSDAYTNVSLSVASANSTGLTLNVNYGSTPCTAANPTVAPSPLDPSIYPGNSATYNVSVTNNDSSGCAASTFNLASTQPSGWSSSFSTNSVTLNPGQSTTVAMYKGGPSGTAPGTYAVNANVSNNSHASSGTANVTVMTPPSFMVTASLPGSSFAARSTVPITAVVSNGGTPTSGASVTFTLTTPSGNTTTQTATTGSTGSATWNYKTSARSLAGTYSVTAQASLTSGGRKNSSTQQATSNTVSFTIQ